MELAISFLAVIGAYLIGSLSFAVIVSRAFGLSDPRSYGSKNPGATNVLRSGNKAAAAVTLLLDALKGWLPVWAANHWAGVAGFGDGTLALVGLAAFIGHLFPVFFKFKGGKGVATAAGVLFGVDWLLGLLTLLAWVAVVVHSISLSLSSAAACSRCFLLTVTLTLAVTTSTRLLSTGSLTTSRLLKASTSLKTRWQCSV